MDLKPHYHRPPRVVAIGCTGGQHRSVAVANALTQHLTVRDEDVRLLNRDRKRG